MKVKILSLILIWLMAFSCSVKPLDHKAFLEKGRIDLSQEDFSNQIFHLHGETEFYWNQFIHSSSEEEEPSSYISIPNSWTSQFPRYGSASYAVHINLPPHIDHLSFLFSQVYSCYEVLINGQSVYRLGQPSLNFEQIVPQLRYPSSFVYSIDPGVSELEIVVHVSNKSYHRNGVKSIRIGLPEEMAKFEQNRTGSGVLILGMLIALTLYHFILAIQRKEQPYVLYFAFFCFFIALRSYIIDNALIFTHFPHIPFTFWDRLQRMGVFPLTGLFVSYICGLYEKESIKWILRVNQAASILFSIAAFVLPLSWISNYSVELFYPFILIALFYSFFVLIKAKIQSRDEVLPILMGFSVFFATIIFDLLLDREILPSYINYTQDKGVLIFILFQAYAISQRLTRAFKSEKRLRMLLEGVQSRLELTIEGAKLGIIEWNIERDEWFINANFYQILGYKSNNRSISRQFWLDLIHPEDKRGVEYHLEKLLSGQIKNYRTEYRMKNNKDEYVWLMLLGRVIHRDDQGNPQWFSGLNIDISDKKRNEESLNQLVKDRTRELEQARIDAEEANRAKSTFLANMSHEIRTPINGVTGMAEMLLETSLDADQKEYTHVIVQSSQALLSIINDILDFSKIESQRIELESRPFNLQSMCEEIFQMLQNRAEKNDLELLLNYDPGAPRDVWGDEARIRQVLTNLLSNAIKFTPQGYILLEISWEKEGIKRGRFEFKVSDTGIGISKDNKKKVFDNFTQADVTTTRLYGGSGLGLTISRQLIELMGGTLELESEEGKGTQFSFVLDMEIIENPEWEEEMQQLRMRNLNILVAGASVLSTRILKHYFEYWKINGVFVGTALEIRNKMLNASYDYLLLMDYLPDMNTQEILQLINENDQSCKMIQLLFLDDVSSQKQLPDSEIPLFLRRPLIPSKLFKIFLGKYEEEFISISDQQKNRQQISAHILVAEDNKFNQRVVAAMLDKIGCTFELVENGYEVLDKLRNVKDKGYDLILMDCQMPLLDGYKTSGLVRLLDGPVASIPIVALTANALMTDRQKCLDAGMDEYLPKPINIKSLREIILSQMRNISLPRVDEEALLLNKKKFMEMIGSEEAMDELIELFISNAKKIMEQIDENVKDENWNQLKILAHKLKGMAGNAGADLLYEKSTELEDSLIHNENKDIIFGHIFELKHEWSDLYRELSTY